MLCCVNGRTSKSPPRIHACLWLVLKCRSARKACDSRLRAYRMQHADLSLLSRHRRRFPVPSDWKARGSFGMLRCCLCIFTICVPDQAGGRQAGALPKGSFDICELQGIAFAGAEREEGGCSIRPGPLSTLHSRTTLLAESEVMPKAQASSLSWLGFRQSSLALCSLCKARSRSGTSGASGTSGTSGPRLVRMPKILQTQVMLSLQSFPPRCASSFRVLDERGGLQIQRHTQQPLRQWQIEATCTRFKLDDGVRNRLTNAMRNRATTFKAYRGFSEL